MECTAENSDKLSNQAWEQSKTAAGASQKLTGKTSSADVRKAADAHQKAADAHGMAADAHSEGSMNKKGQAGQDHWAKNQSHRGQQAAHTDQSKQLAETADSKAQYESDSEAY